MTRIGSIACAIVLIVATLWACSAKSEKADTAARQLPASIVSPYLNIQQALFHDTTDGVKASAGELATAATALGAPAVKIDMAAVRLAAAGDLADARAKFGELSDALLAYMNGTHLSAPEGVRVAFCPMAAKEWLQKGSSIENPYYGSSMATCGNFR